MGKNEILKTDVRDSAPVEADDKFDEEKIF